MTFGYDLSLKAGESSQPSLTSDDPRAIVLSLSFRG